VAVGDGAPSWLTRVRSDESDAPEILAVVARELQFVVVRVEADVRQPVCTGEPVERVPLVGAEVAGAVGAAGRVWAFGGGHGVPPFWCEGRNHWPGRRSRPVNAVSAGPSPLNPCYVRDRPPRWRASCQLQAAGGGSPQMRDVRRWPLPNHGRRRADVDQSQSAHCRPTYRARRLV
jgi:hypothetical protein